MTETEGRGEENQEEREAQQAERDRLFAEFSESMNKIEEGIDTSTAQLDRHLTAYAAYNLYILHHQHPANYPFEDAPTEYLEQEQRGVEYLKTTKILNGSYHKEKADYCLELSASNRRTAAYEEKALAAGLEDPKDKELSGAILKHSRTAAANWLRTAANCLTMPEAPKDTPMPSDEGN